MELILSRISKLRETLLQTFNYVLGRLIRKIREAFYQDMEWQDMGNGLNWKRVGLDYVLGIICLLWGQWGTRIDLPEKLWMPQTLEVSKIKMDVPAPGREVGLDDL